MIFSYILWLILIGLFLFWVIRGQASKEGWLTIRVAGLPIWSLVSLLLVLALLPVFSGLSLVGLLLGFFDLPSVMFVGVSILTVFKPDSTGFKLAWYGGGGISLLLIATYLVGWVGPYEFGYEPLFTLVLIAWFMFFVFIRSVAGMLLVCLAILSALFDLTQSGNGWHVLADTIWAITALLRAISALVVKSFFLLRGKNSHSPG